MSECVSVFGCVPGDRHALRCTLVEDALEWNEAWSIAQRSFWNECGVPEPIIAEVRSGVAVFTSGGVVFGLMTAYWCFAVLACPD